MFFFTEYMDSPTGYGMIDHTEILTLLKERVRILSLIRDHYLKNQTILVSDDPEKHTQFEKQHKVYLEEMLQVEENWRSLVVRIKTEHEIHSENTDIILSLTLHEDFITRYFAYKDRLYQILSELERIKKNSSLLAKKSFPFIPHPPEKSEDTTVSILSHSKDPAKHKIPLTDRKLKNR